MTSSSKVRILIEKHLVEQFLLTCGVKQSNLLSPLIFTLHIEMLIMAIIMQQNIKTVTEASRKLKLL